MNSENQKTIRGCPRQKWWTEYKVTKLGMNNNEKVANDWGRDGKKDVNVTKDLNSLP